MLFYMHVVRHCRNCGRSCCAHEDVCWPGKRGSEEFDAAMGKAAPCGRYRGELYRGPYTKNVDLEGDES